jgi:hypothetical protein
MVSLLRGKTAVLCCAVLCVICLYLHIQTVTSQGHFDRQYCACILASALQAIIKDKHTAFRPKRCNHLLLCHLLLCHLLLCHTHTHTHRQRWAHLRTHTHTHTNSIPVREMHSPVAVSPVNTTHTHTHYETS